MKKIVEIISKRSQLMGDDDHNKDIIKNELIIS